MRIEYEQNRFWVWVCHFIRLAVLFLVLFAPCKEALSYVMPTSQILEMMSKNFSSVHTVVVKQWVKVSGAGDEEEGTLSEVKVWIKRPWFSRCRRTGAMEEGDGIPYGRGCGWCNVAEFQCMFLSHSVAEMIGFLSRLGVQTSKTSLTHLGSRVAYLIGNKRKGESYIIVSRERFLPLLIHIGPVGSPMGPFNIRFEEYRQAGKAFYPYRIVCEPEHGPTEEYVAQDVQANVTIDPSIFQPAMNETNAQPIHNIHQTSDDERIRGIVETLQQKYQ